jgi:hypothetical protein
MSSRGIRSWATMRTTAMRASDFFGSLPSTICRLNRNRSRWSCCNERGATASFFRRSDPRWPQLSQKCRAPSPVDLVCPPNLTVSRAWRHEGSK